MQTETNRLQGGHNVPDVAGGAPSIRHLLSELRRIEALIQAEVHRVRQQHKADDQPRGLFISEEDVDGLLAQGPSSRFSDTAQVRITEREDVSAPPELIAASRLLKLASLFGLRQFDLDCILVCLATEIDPRYERLYAYLQDDITKRRPSVDLVLNLLCPRLEAKIDSRQRFLPGAPLIKSKVLELFEDPSQPHPTLLGRYLKVDDRITNYLLGSDELDARLSSYVRFVETDELDRCYGAAEQVEPLTVLARQDKLRGLVVYLQGPYGSGKQETAYAFCRNAGIRLLTMDARRLAAMPEPDFRSLVEWTLREAVLQSAAVYWASFDALTADDRSTHLSFLLRELDGRTGITFLGAETAWQPKAELRLVSFLRLELQPPSYAERVRSWSRILGEKSDVDVASVATKFRFTQGQIRDAAATARDLARWRDPEHCAIKTADLYEACRLQSNRKLSALARKIKPHYAWDDIILPSDRVQQLREICNSVKYRSVVYDQWGFDRKLSLGKGLNILFAGPPGTGKTMAAEIMAGELGLDLYKTDLSTVVSKYIGETEKNLSRIFAEAETSNAILFFDEADALFGKRSEVRDSHDRYANIEINYLLQKMEEHEGVVILATNFRKNMDEAFVRRLHFTIDFPFPDEGDRRRIWEAIWPKETPRHVELDLHAIARRFEIAGGNIRNIALGAAFLAAENGGVVKMQHLLHATRREYQKMGKVVMHGEFE